MLRAAILTVLSASSLLAQAPVTTISARATVKDLGTSNRDARSPVTLVSQTRLLSREAAAGMAVPAGVSEPWFGAFDVGGGQVAVIIGKEEGRDVLFVDRDADGELGDGESMPIEVTMVRSSPPVTLRSETVQVNFSINGREFAGTVGFLRSGDGAPEATFRSFLYLEAALEVDGGKRVVAVVDEDLDGTFGSEGDAWTLAKPGETSSVYYLNPMGASSFRDGRRFSVRVTGDLVHVTVAKAEGPDPASQLRSRERMERIWFDSFDLDREAFVKERGIDTTRPTGRDPIDWSYVTLDQGVALSKESGKLLFADVRRFSDARSYWLDYYTYPDDEVAALMRQHFVPVKIIDEQNRVGDYRGVRALLEDRSDPAWSLSAPAMGIFDGDGRLVHKIIGWKPAQALAEDLKEAVVRASSPAARGPVEAVTVSVKAMVKVADREVVPPLEPVSQSLKLSREAPAGMAVPSGISEAWFGAFVAGGRKVAVIFGKEGSRDVLLVDRNADGRLEIGEKRAIDMAAEPSRSLLLFWGLVDGPRSEPVPVTLSIEGREVPVRIGVIEDGWGHLWFDSKGIPGVLLRSPVYLEAALDIGGQSRILRVLDEDLDGRFGSEGDAWILALTGEHPERILYLNAMEASSFRNGQRFSVNVSDDGVEVTVVTADGPDPASEARNRKRVEGIWFDRFDLDREAFAVQRGFDTSRPTDKDPIEWSYITFDQGLLLAKESGKLLFADARNFLSAWCYWLDYYTYPDDEVAALMKEHFVPVKIIDEQDRAGDYDRVLGLLEDRSDPAWRVRHTPAIGIFDGEGNLVHKIDLNGAMPAQALVEDLKTAISRR